MKCIRQAVASVFLVAVAGASVALAKDPMVGGAPMLPSKTIVQNATDSNDHTTLVAAVKAANLVDTLSGPGPFTVFAPTNEAFKKLPAGAVDNLLKPENKAQLQAILNYHIVPGRLTTKDIREQIKAGGGKATLRTVQGETLTAEEKGKGLEILDSKGDAARVTIPNVMQSNGVIHVIDTLLLP